MKGSIIKNESIGYGEEIEERDPKKKSIGKKQVSTLSLIVLYRPIVLAKGPRIDRK